MQTSVVETLLKYRSFLSTGKSTMSAGGWCLIIASNTLPTFTADDSPSVTPLCADFQVSTENIRSTLSIKPR